MRRERPFEPGDPDGVEPVRMHVNGIRRRVRSPCNRKSPRQERSVRLVCAAPCDAGASGHGPHHGSEAQKPNPSGRRSMPLIVLHSCVYTERPINPTKINRGGRLDQQARGPGRSETIGHPWREQACEGSARQRALNPRSAVGRGLREGPTRPARPRRLESVAEHRAKSSARCMTGCGRRMCEAMTLHDAGRCWA